MVEVHRLIELASSISQTSPHDMIYGRRKHYYGRFVAYYLLTHYARMSKFRIALLFGVSKDVVPFALKSIRRKQERQFRTRQDEIFVQMIEECNSILTEYQNG